MKKVLIGLVLLLGVAVTGVAVWLHTSLDGIVESAIQKYGTEILQAKVKVKSVKLTPIEGMGTINGLHIANPKGFRTSHAVEAGSIELSVDPASIPRDVVLIRRIALTAPHVNYETSDAGPNIDALQRNVNQYLGPAASGSKADSKPARKLIVEHLSIRDARVSYAPGALQGKTIDFSLPNIEMRNIGKAKGGVTPAELVTEITAAVEAQIIRSLNQTLKGAAGAVGKSVGDAARGVGDKVKGLFK
jgi:uncharacterized protein involved in outer membrane biogenesis